MHPAVAVSRREVERLADVAESERVEARVQAPVDELLRLVPRVVDIQIDSRRSRRLTNANASPDG